MDNRPVCVIQHVACETLGRIAEALKAEGLGAEVIRTQEQNPIPAGMDNYKGLIVMGGPMGVYEQERYGFLGEEMRLMQLAVKQNKPVLGICLGSQLLAAALGATVSKSGFKEIGWHPVRLNDSALHDPLWNGVPRSFQALHWHGDIFTLPEGAVPLANSDLTDCQAFRYGPSAYGFLFHMEVTPEVLQGMVSTFSDELKQAQINPEQIIEPAKTHLANLHYIGSSVFQRWARLVRTLTPSR